MGRAHRRRGRRSRRMRSSACTARATSSFAGRRSRSSLTGLAVLVAVEEGTVDLDEPAGPEGSTLRHLLSHASGLPPDEGPPLMPPGAAAHLLERGDRARRVARRASAPRSRSPSTSARRSSSRSGSPARSTARPRGATAARSTTCSRSGASCSRRRSSRPRRSTRRPRCSSRGSRACCPSFGRMDPNDWGLAFELRDDKSPHWTSAHNSPRTFGHFGAAGTFLWVDPELGLRVRRADGQGVRRVGARSVAALQRLSRPRTAGVGSRRTSRGRSSRRRRA